MIFWISVFILKMFSKIYFRGTATGKENYPEKGSYIAVVNHSSNMDVFAMALMVKHTLHTMAKDSLFRIPVLRWWVKAVNMFPVIRDTSDRKAFNHAINILKNGQVLAIAPEGTRKKSSGKRNRHRTVFIR